MLNLDIINVFQYFGITPDQVLSFLWFLLASIGGGFVVYLLVSGNLKKKFEPEIRAIREAVIEIQVYMRNVKPKAILEHSLNRYAQAKSPIVLKEEFKEFITKPRLDRQIVEKENELLDWLRRQKPKTGLDAQDYISTLVSSNEISKYLDLTSYKQYLYQKGKTSEDASGILAVYLFEALIPKLNISNKKNEKET